MRAYLTLLIDNQAVYQVDRNTRLPGRQRDFLDKMDEDMDQGIQLGEEQIANPDSMQRARYVAQHLIQAYQDDNQPLMTATSAYLINRLPSLNTIRVELHDQQSHLQLILDQ